MKCSYLQLTTLISLGLAAPLFVFADAWLGAPNVPPPQGNTPGIIWNTIDLGNVVQPQARINIDGNATVGGSAIVAGNATIGSTLNVTGKGTILDDSKFKRDVYLSDTFAFRVDQDGLASFNMGNWGGPVAPNQKPLSMNINGDLFLHAIFPYTDTGNRGRVQAEEFCLNPGADADCITASKGWPSGNSGLYVQKIGDVMSGGLTINLTPGNTGVAVSGGGIGGVFTGSFWGVEATSDNFAVYAHTDTAGKGTAVWGTNGATGGLFQGTVNGVRGTASNAGSSGGYFTGTNGYGVTAEGLTAGIQGNATGPADNSVGGIFNAVAPYGSGAIATGKLYGIQGNTSAYGTGVAGSGGYFGGVFEGTNAGALGYASAIDGNAGIFVNTYPTPNISTDISGRYYGLKTNGDIIAPSNTLANCALQPSGFVDGAVATCPASLPLMNGMKRVGTTTYLNCCQL